MPKKRVVITGLGCVTPLGHQVEDTWQKLLQGQSGITEIDGFDTAPFPVTFGGQIKDLDLSPYLSAKDARKMDPFIHYGVVAATQALHDSGLTVTPDNAEHIGVSMGSGIGGIATIEAQHSALQQKGPRRVSPFFVPGSIVNMVSGNVSIMHGLQGPNMAIGTACASGTHSIGDAMRMIQYGDAMAMIAGGSEHAVTPLGLGGFAAAKALSTRNEAPTEASRPWDQDRDGFVLSDGAGAVMLEEYEFAKARGADIYCEVIGFGMSGDAYHMTKPAPNGQGGARCMRQALKDAQLNPGQLDYINAHGTSTPAGDVCEAQAIESVLGTEPKRPWVSSTKSMTGHALGAAGAMEAVFVAKMLATQKVTPTINLHKPDFETALDLVPGQARDAHLQYALSNSLGFGGTNAALVFAKAP